MVKIKNIKILIGLFLFSIVVLPACLAPFCTKYDYNEQHLMSSRLPPAWDAAGSLEHPLGTDFLGRDLLANILYGVRYTLLIAIIAASLSAFVGVTAGVFAGFYGGLVDRLVVGMVDIQLAIPTLILALAIAVILGPGLTNLIIVLAVTSWAGYARIARATSMRLKNLQYIEAARALGLSTRRILARHIVPNCLPEIFVYFTLETARIVLTEASLSFLGMGVPPPLPSLGRLLADNRLYLFIDYWIALFPGLTVMIIVLSINTLGDGLRDLCDPMLRRRKL
ncbi:MAG: ABC transporter permease [Candidatus Hadarchaeum sp.]|uniref:ABC transporter permease n=1 Tax=Candidatus Hadarchaeum sp. TaxID=2883567 RepID=UPI0031789946